MIAHTLTAALSLAAVLGGCAVAKPEVDFYDTDSATLRRFEAMKVVDTSEAQTTDYLDLGAVEGRYCESHYAQDPVYSPLARAHAVDQVMLIAAGLGATHITRSQCKISNDNGCLFCTSHALMVQSE